VTAINFLARIYNPCQTPKSFSRRKLKTASLPTCSFIFFIGTTATLLYRCGNIRPTGLPIPQLNIYNTFTYDVSFKTMKIFPQNDI
jgi:hypothetical protein